MTEVPYRATLLLLLVGGFAAAALVARRMEAPGGAVDRSADGPAMAAAIKVAGIAYYGSLLAYIVWPASLSWAGVPLPAWARAIGAGLFAAGIALAVWARAALGDSSTVTAVPAPDAELVTRGPYRWFRHPVYSGGLLMAPGAAALTANLFVLAAGVAVLLVLDVRTRREEQLLLERFGDAYREVMDRTGRWLPRRRRP